jgi:hypothetical protein
MTKIIRMTESDLTNLVKRVIKEQMDTLPTPIKQITKSLGLDKIINMGKVNYSVKKLPTGKFKIFVTTPEYKTPVDASSAFGQGTMWKEYDTQQEAQNVINSIVDKKGKSGFGIDPLAGVKHVGKSLGLTGIEEQVSNKKVVRLTESDLTILVKRVIKEQSAQIKSVDNVKTAPKQSTGQIKSVDTMSKSDSSSWFSNFPCLNGQPKSKKQIVNGNVVWKPNDSGQQYILLPQSGKNDPLAKQVQQYKPVDGYIGQVKGGGVYYCSSEAYAKGFGPQIMK